MTYCLHAVPSCHDLAHLPLFVVTLHLLQVYGLLYGGGVQQVAVQAVGVLAIAAWAGLWGGLASAPLSAT